MFQPAGGQGGRPRRPRPKQVPKKIERLAEDGTGAAQALWREKRPYTNVGTLVPKAGVAIIVNRRCVICDMLVGADYRRMTAPGELFNRHIRVLFGDERTPDRIAEAVGVALRTGQSVDLGKIRVVWGEERRTFKGWVVKYDLHRCAVCGIYINNRQLPDASAGAL